MEMTFDADATEHVLASVGAAIDGQGYVVDEETGKRKTNPDGEEIKADDVAIVEDGSTIFVDENFDSLVKHVERQR